LRRHPGNLVESVLFGHEKGSFTGAFDRHIGRFEDADGSTLFLDEVGELPLETQVKLLRAIESGEIQRLGSRITNTVDVRIIAATNRRLTEEVAAERFREDLFYRLNVVNVSIPPLRDRITDLPALARHLLVRIAEQPGMRYLSITDDALAVLMSYGWPGNVRQLQNALFRAAVLCDRDALTAADFPHIATESAFGRRQDDYHAKRLSGASQSAAMEHGPGVTLYESDGHVRKLDEIEADVIRLAIGHYRGRMTEVARRLGHRPLHPLPQARRTRHRERGLARRCKAAVRLSLSKPLPSRSSEKGALRQAQGERGGACSLSPCGEIVPAP
jgi:DNA-binding NtrC family response regulator